MFVSPDKGIRVPELTPLYDGRMTKVLSPIFIQENRRAGKLEPQRSVESPVTPSSVAGLSPRAIATYHRTRFF
jgi:hypothetical protein